jgi:hypothetical protein
MDYGLEGLGIGVESQQKQEIFSFLRRIQTGFGAHSFPYPMDIGCFFSGGSVGGRETDYSQQSNAQAKNMWIHIVTCPGLSEA